MKNIEIQVNSKNNEVFKNSETLGITSENLQGKIIFKPEPFIEGTCRMYIEGRGSILMEKEDNCYVVDILSSLLTELSLDICFKITEPTTEKGTPIFCSKIIHFKVLDTIESNEEIPDQYPTWIEIFDAKIAQLEALEEDVEEAEVERNAAVQEAIGNIQDMTAEYNQNAVAKTNAFNTNATNKTNAFDTHVSNKEAEFDTDTDTIVSTKKAELDSYEQTKESELDTHTDSLKNDLDSYESAKETELNTYTGTKKEELNTYTNTKKKELDTYEGTKETELNTYANGLKNDFDTNATNKTNAFNTNATNKTTDFDNNASLKTTDFNNNATIKTEDFNTNAVNKTAEFNANAQSIQNEIDAIEDLIETELERITTEKSTRVDITDAAKWYGNLCVDGRTIQTTSELTYKCIGTEIGDYYFTYNSINYQFTMPTIQSGDILVFNTTTLTLSLNETVITTTTEKMGTELTFIVSPNPNYPQEIRNVTNDITFKIANENEEQTILFPLAEGQKLMGGDYLADDGIHHIKNQIICNGTEDWKYEYKTYYLNLSTTAKTFSSFDPNNVLATSTHFKWGNGQSNNFKYGALWYTTNGNKLRLQYDENGDVNNFKSWLASLYANNTPLIVEYERNEETVEAFTSQQEQAYDQLKKLILYQGINHIWTETDVLGPNLQLKYCKSNKLRLDSIEARLELLEE